MNGYRRLYCILVLWTMAASPKIFILLNTNDISRSIFVENRSCNSCAMRSRSVVRLKFFWKRNIVSDCRNGYLFCKLWVCYSLPTHKVPNPSVLWISRNTRTCRRRNWSRRAIIRRLGLPKYRYVLTAGVRPIDVGYRRLRLVLLLLLVCVSFTIIGQPWNRVLIRRV